eukprot:CAMPEP_0115124640 /NCGR_PEP_ID=MMETSP0227-20121206/48467_1 /TAXON_ID=89957 /ORGANISM="Polarella glacialis, Strain CCMP 1383" /LENGTH=80 /DNA_ID=CAMNT_0002527659 /DNA_START=56 /DNA_END=296 /DNA_ORIENTATION=+
MGTYVVVVVLVEDLVDDEVLVPARDARRVKIVTTREHGKHLATFEVCQANHTGGVQVAALYDLVQYLTSTAWPNEVIKFH